MTDVRRLDEGPLRVGSRTRIKQPGLPTLVWQVTTIEENAHFVWVARSPGVATTARHELEDIDGGVRLTLSVTWTGPLGGLVGWLAGTRTQAFLDQETQGAKNRTEHR